MGAKLNWTYIFCCGVGSVFGIVLGNFNFNHDNFKFKAQTNVGYYNVSGFEVLDGLFPFTERKISFIGIWFSSALGMFLCNK
jgi:hypothetical protein